MNNAGHIVNVGVFGYGPVSAARTFHVPLITYTSGLRLHTVATQSVPEAKKLINDDTVRIIESLDEVIADPVIDLVVIALPNTMHYEYARKCLEAGKHVIVEKPLCVTAAEIDELMGIARHHDRLLLQFHNRRFDGGFLTIQKLIADGSCGVPKLLEMNYDRWMPEIAHGTWRESDALGGGTVYDLGVHVIDQALCLFGNPSSVKAGLYFERPDAKAVDAFDITLSYPDHRVVLRSSMLASLPAPRYRLVGANGNYTKYGIDPQAGQLNSGMLPGNTSYGHDTPAEYGMLALGSDAPRPLSTEPGCHQEFYRRVADYLLRGEALHLSAADAHAVITVVEAAYRSHKEQRTIAADELHFITT